MAERVPLYNSNGFGSCQVCGTPTPPRLITYFDGKWVCQYHRFRHTRAEAEKAFSHDIRRYRNFIQITGSLGFTGTDATMIPPPTVVTPPTGGGGGGEPPNPGGGGGTPNPPPTTPPDGIPEGMVEGNICIE